MSGYDLKKIIWRSFNLNSAEPDEIALRFLILAVEIPCSVELSMNIIFLQPRGQVTLNLNELTSTLLTVSNL